MTTELIANEPSGLRGWLAFMGLGVALAPVRNLVEWGSLTSDKDMQFLWESGVPLARNYVLATHGVSAAAFAGSVWLAFLFFGKDRRFPFHFMVIQSATVAILLALATWITLASGTNAFAEMMPELAPYAVIAFFWCIYLHRSVRVANTFVK